MPRPWFRSRLFWLGAVCLIFLVWAWRDSGAHAAGIQWGNPGRLYTVAHFKSSLRFVVSPTTAASIRPGFSSYRNETPDEYRLRPRPLGFGFAEVVLVRAREDAEEENGVVVHFAYWLLVLIFLILWLTALIGWQRRKIRKAAPPEPTMPIS